MDGHPMTSEPSRQGVFNKHLKNEWTSPILQIGKLRLRLNNRPHITQLVNEEAEI